MITATCLAELISYVKTLKSNNSVLIYRGQGDIDWGLEPSIYRFVKKLDPPYSKDDDSYWISEVERDLYRTFHDRGMRLLPEGARIAHTQWSSLFLAQHYGLPTRFLDWSRDCLTATYFACASDHSTDAAVHILDISAIPHPQALGRLSGNGGFRLEALTQAVVDSELSFFVPQSRLFGSKGSIALPRSLSDLKCDVHTTCSFQENLVN